MSEQRIQNLEKDVGGIKSDVAVMKSSMDPLMKKMDESTAAMMDLTAKLHELAFSNKFMQTGFDDLKESVITQAEDTKESIKSQNERIKSLEALREMKRSGDKVKDWALRALITTIVPLFILAIGYLMFNKPG